jgi:hypothetical protein
MLILLFVGFGKVLVDIGAVDEAEKHGANERGKNRLNLP